MEQMPKYERSISLKTVGLTIVRRWTTILLFFIPIAAVAYIVTNNIMTKTYQSTTTLTNGAVISQAQWPLIEPRVKTSIEATVEALAVSDAEHTPVKHANGAAITAKEITSGITVSKYVANTLTFTISFQSTDSTIVQPVLAELAEQTVVTLKEDASTKTPFAAVSITSEASKAAKNSSEQKYFLIGLAAGAVLALGIAFLDEILSDEVYDAKDVAQWGVPAFDMKAR